MGKLLKHSFFKDTYQTEMIARRALEVNKLSLHRIKVI